MFDKCINKIKKGYIHCLDIGKTYKVETTGFRVHILSWYKNINKYELIEQTN